MAQPGSIQTQRFELMVAEIAKSRNIVWKLLGSRSNLAGTAYGALTDAQELCHTLYSDLFSAVDWISAGERCRHLLDVLGKARSALAELAEEQRDAETALQQVRFAHALLLKLAGEIAPDETFDEET